MAADGGVTIALGGGDLPWDDHAQDVFDIVKGNFNVQQLSIPYPYLPEYHMMERVQSWPSSKFPIFSSQYNPYFENGYIPQGIPQHQTVKKWQIRPTRLGERGIGARSPNLQVYDYIEIIYEVFKV
ncbi:Uncharacterized protein Fot_15768 [Forsythia ovata]|uniref:Uncharacterized protein n=1 Tax=Forsythia ovata TaxID=205694 RepID=A0ABD1WAM9_9LAMI